MSPQRRERKYPRAPAAHERIGPFTFDPENTAAPVACRLIAARNALSRHVAEYEEALAAIRLEHQLRDPLLDPNAAHNRPEFRATSGIEEPSLEEIDGYTLGGDGDDDDDDDDDVDMNSGDWAPHTLPEPGSWPGVTRKGLTAHDRPPFAERSLKRPEYPDRYLVDGWPPNTTLGQDHWPQLRWRPWRRFDEGQRRLDRIEMGEWWHRSLRDQLNAHTERKLDDWVRRNDLLGVVFAGPGDTGWLPDPALARVVVYCRHLRRTAMWILWNPPPTWTPEAFDLYRAHTTPTGPPDGLLEICDSISRQPELAGAILADFSHSTKRGRP